MRGFIPFENKNAAIYKIDEIKKKFSIIMLCCSAAGFYTIMIGPLINLVVKLDPQVDGGKMMGLIVLPCFVVIFSILYPLAVKEFNSASFKEE